MACRRSAPLREDLATKDRRPTAEQVPAVHSAVAHLAQLGFRHRGHLGGRRQRGHFERFLLYIGRKLGRGRNQSTREIGSGQGRCRERGNFQLRFARGQLRCVMPLQHERHHGGAGNSGHEGSTARRRGRLSPSMAIPRAWRREAQQKQASQNPQIGPDRTVLLGLLHLGATLPCCPSWSRRWLTSCLSPSAH